MSVRNLQQSSLASKRLGYVNLRPFYRPKGAIDYEITPYVRNPSWLPLPQVEASEEKVVGLHMVWPNDDNHLAFTFSGNHTIDWGDGMTENVAAGVRAQHTYSYDGISANNAPVTFTAVESLVSRTAHGMIDGDAVQFYDIVNTTGVASGQVYYVVNATADTFQFSLTVGGTPVTFTNNGTGALLPYKQVIVTITPQAGGQLTSMQLTSLHSALNATNPTSSAWLDLTVSLPQTTTFVISTTSTSLVVHRHLENATILSLGAANTFAGLFVNCNNLQRVHIAASTSGITSTANMFQNCFNLRSAPWFDTSNVTTMANMFSGCQNLVDVPLYDLSNVTTMAAMFTNCSSLQAIPPFNTGKVTTMLSTFSGCRSLRALPLMDTSKVTTIASAFVNCNQLETIPQFDFSSLTTASTAFNNCFSVVSFPAFNLPNCTIFTSMFQGCAGLVHAPVMNTPNATMFTTMFSACTSLRSVPLYNSAKVTDFSSMFVNCYQLGQVPHFDTGNATTMASMFSGCYALAAIPQFDTSKVTTFSGMFSTCVNLRVIPSLDTPAATNMNNMFNACYRLTNVPWMNTSNVVTMTSMFQGCTGLQTVPLFNTSKVTDFSFMFSGCVSLTQVPCFSFAAAGITTNMFDGCSSLRSTPAFTGGANIATMTNMFLNCLSLTTVGPFTTSAVSGAGGVFDGCRSLRVIPAFNLPTLTTPLGVANTSSVGSYLATGMRINFTVVGRLSAAELERVFWNTGVGNAGTITITGNPGALTFSRTCATTAGSTTVTCSDTSSLAVGMEVHGTGISPAVSVSFDDAADTVSRTAHGLANGSRVSFSVITTTTGIVTWTPYHVVNATANTFQVSATQGGAPINLVNNGTGSMLYGTTVTAIVPNTSVTISVPASSAFSGSLTFGAAKRSIARMKNFAVSP
jgi:surface protein